MRELLTVIIFSVVALGIFLIFVATGFPGSPDTCLTDPSLWGAPDSCYCEHFNVADIGQPGARQPWNTWSNFMGIVFGSLVAFGAWQVRTGEDPGFTNRLRSTSYYPLIYICVVIFLGLGSMWFHGSMVHWASAFDLLSMFIFVDFIVAYSFVRLVPGAWDWLVGVIYLVATIALTIILSKTSFNSALVILPLICAAAAMEVATSIKYPERRADTRGYIIIGLGALSFALAFVFWILSQSGGPLCFPTGFQFHAAWHWLAGVTSVAFYYFWIRARG